MSNSGGEEFLQPKSRAPLPSGLSLSGSPPTPTMKFCSYGTHMTSDGSCAPQNQHNWNQERLRFAQSHGLDPNSLLTMNTSDASSIRYCGDSLKYKGGSVGSGSGAHGGGDVGSDEYDSGRSQAQVGNVKLELPLDEDDYLVPSPQQNQNYVDLIGESRNINHANSDSTPDTSMYSGRSYSEFSKTNIDNPEYLMNGETPSQTIGIPTVSEFVHASESHAHNCPNPAQPYLPQKSVEEESDHEYYNDFDRLQRELQPLQKKNETAV